MTAAVPETAPEPTPTDDPLTENGVLAEVLVEEISIDGMCGVY